MMLTLLFLSWSRAILNPLLLLLLSRRWIGSAV